MKDKTYDNKEYWNKLRKSRDYYEEEHVTLEGKGGDTEFDGEILEAVGGKDVLDVGCGVGLFTIEIARRAKEVVGVDFSEEAVARAKRNQAAEYRLKNLRFKQADARRLPFEDAQFDVVVSRRGPATSSLETLSEACRVLREGGLLMEITIGERDKANLVKIFGRGQMYGMKEAVAASKRRMLDKTGFKEVVTVDYIATEIFETMKDLIIRLNSAPIIPGFDVEKDKRFLAIVEKTCLTPRGIETPIHRVTIVSRR
jgi:SAM-dependent methyltransferase